MRFFQLFLLSCLFTIALTAAPASSILFSPDGKILAVGGRMGVRLFSRPQGDAIEPIQIGMQRVLALDFSDDGEILVTGGGTAGETGALAVIDWQSRKVLRQHSDFTDWISCVAVNREGTRLAVGSADFRAVILPLNGETNESPTITLAGHSGSVLGVDWSPDSSLIVTASADRSLKVWSGSNGQLLRSFAQHTEAVHAVVFRPGWNPENPQCASASDDGTVRIWQPKIGRMVRIIREHGGPVFALAYAPDGSALFSAGRDGMIRSLDVNSDRILRKWTAHNEPIYSLAVSPDGKVLASGDWAGLVKLWRIQGAAQDETSPVPELIGTIQ